MRWSVVIVVALSTVLTSAQESMLHADFRREGERFRDACAKFDFKAVAGCATELFTDHPLHLSAASLAPQNGFAFGPAFVAHYTPNESWRLNWSVDAVASTNASWRAGGYMKIIHTPVVQINPVAPTEPNPSAGAPKSKAKPGRKPFIHPYTVFNLYAQAISLNRVNFFGLGPNSLAADRTVFGMRETIVGGSVIKPVYEWPAIRKLNLALLGEINGRFVDLRGNRGESSPSIEALFTEAAAPGLARQPGFIQFGEGVRIKPVLFNDHLQLNYLANFQQFVAPSSSHYSFMRWTVDLGHTVNLYGHTQAGPRDTNTPNECTPSLTEQKCPSISYSRNLDGSIGVRLLLSESITGASSVVPFFFQPTLGGSDINGLTALGSYQDYRFRGPNVLLLRESFEHSIWGPFGFSFMADQGKVALKRSDIAFDHLNHSFATGITLRAGGFPMVYLLYAWGGNEGNHTIFNMNTSLLGGSARPKLD